MGRKITISPSLLAANSAILGEEAKRAENGGAEWLHLDIMDGHFVPNLSFSAQIVKAIRPLTKIFFDVHLMISDPKFYLDDFIDAGADLITFHFEAVEDTEKIRDMAEYLHSKGVKAGISVKPKTDVMVLEPVLDIFDLVLIMTVEPGFGGQAYMSDMADKIKWISDMADTRYTGIDVEVDGGINAETAKHASSYGANILVAGSAVFKADDSEKVISDIRNNAELEFGKR